MSIAPTSQIEHWAMIGKYAEDNPDMPYSLIKEVMLGVQELDHGGREEYKFG